MSTLLVLFLAAIAVVGFIIWRRKKSGGASGSGGSIKLPFDIPYLSKSTKDQIEEIKVQAAKEEQKGIELKALLDAKRKLQQAKASNNKTRDDIKGLDGSNGGMLEGLGLAPEKPKKKKK